MNRKTALTLKPGDKIYSIDTTGHEWRLCGPLTVTRLNEADSEIVIDEQIPNPQSKFIFRTTNKVPWRSYETFETGTAKIAAENERRAKEAAARKAIQDAEAAKHAPRCEAADRADARGVSVYYSEHRMEYRLNANKVTPEEFDAAVAAILALRNARG